MSIVHGGRCDKQVFQYGELVVHSLDDLLQTWNRHSKVYAPNAIAVLEGKHDSLLIFRGEIVILVIVVNDEWKRRGMC